MAFSNINALNVFMDEKQIFRYFQKQFSGAFCQKAVFKKFVKFTGFKTSLKRDPNTRVLL